MEQSLEHNPTVIDGRNPRYAKNDCDCCWLVKYGDMESAVFTDKDKAVEYAKKHDMYHWKYSRIVELHLNPSLEQKP